MNTGVISLYFVPGAINIYVIITSLQHFNTQLQYGVQGVYIIICNCKHYVGVSLDIKRRLQTHKTLLRNNKHDNVYLQRAYNRHGLSSFAVHVQHCSDMYTKERLLIEQLNCVAPHGYNMTVGGEGGDAKFTHHSTWLIKSPQGHIHTVTNMNEFARKHGLSADCLCLVKQGHPNHTQHLGWRRADYVRIHKPTLLEKRGKTYQIKDPHGHVYHVTNELEFAKAHKLVVSQLQKLRNKKIKHHAGWVLN